MAWGAEIFNRQVSLMAAVCPVWRRSGHADTCRICSATGGNPIEQSDGSVTCFYPDGSWSRCEFQTNTCLDSPGIERPPDTIVDPPTGIVAEPSNETDPVPTPGLDDAPAGSYATAAVDDDRKHHKDKGKDVERKKRGPGGKARKK